MSVKSAKQGMHSGFFWALIDHPLDLPVIFKTREQALRDRCDGEYMVRVFIRQIDNRPHKVRKARKKPSTRQERPK